MQRNSPTSCSLTLGKTGPQEIKTFDLRRTGAHEVVPLDDVASAALDLWAAGQGLRRPVRSLAGF